MSYSKKQNSFHKILDRIGAFLGFLCAIHCMITPLALTILPLAGVQYLWSSEGEFWIIGSLFFFALLSAGFAVWWRRSWEVLWGFLISLSFVLSGYYLNHNLSQVHGDTGRHLENHLEHIQHQSSTLGIILSLLGGIGLITFHLRSLRHKPEHTCCHNDSLQTHS